MLEYSTESTFIVDWNQALGHFSSRHIRILYRTKSENSSHSLSRAVDKKPRKTDNEYMQSVSAGFTAEETDRVRKITQNLQISWKKDNLLSNFGFRVGVSTIGGNDVIGINPGAIGSPGNYRYFDESQYVTSLSWERALNFPTGGLTMALAEATLSNTDGRFTPRYMGGNSELFTAILPRRPALINAGFNYDGIDNLIPQFAGQISKNPGVDVRSREVSLQMTDYTNFFQNKYLDQVVMFTGQRTDEVLNTLMVQSGMSTAQYDLDYGINIIPFGIFDKGTRFSDIIRELVEAENGHFYQNEEGIFKFENRQHWDSSPFNTVQRIILTSQVVNAEAPTDDHLVNVVEVKSQVRAKAANQKLWESSSPQLVPANGDLEIFADFTDENGGLPVLAVDTPIHTLSSSTSSTSIYVTNTLQDGSGTPNQSAIYIKSISTFATACKIVFSNNSSIPTYVTYMHLFARPAKVATNIYERRVREASITAYEERPLLIENNYIQSEDWAQSYAEMILQDFSEVDNLQNISIRAMPSLQLGDLVSWQGRPFRIFGIKTRLDPGEGFIQDLQLLQRDVIGYFKVGISLVGSTDRIAP